MFYLTNLYGWQNGSLHVVEGSSILFDICTKRNLERRDTDHFEVDKWHKKKRKICGKWVKLHKIKKSAPKKGWKRGSEGEAGDQFEVGNWHFAPGGRREITVINSGEKLSGRRRWAENYNTSIILYHSRGANNELHWTCDTFQHQNGRESKFPIYLLNWWISGLDILWRYEATYIEKHIDWTKSLSSADFNDLLNASWNIFGGRIFPVCAQNCSIEFDNGDMIWAGGKVEVVSEVI